MADTTVHRCPPLGSALMPCCGCTPFEIPIDERLTLDGIEVTCSQRCTCDCGTDRTCPAHGYLTARASHGDERP